MAVNIYSKMAIPVSVYAIPRWKTILTALFLSDSKGHKHFAGSIEVVVMVIDLIES